MEKAKEIELLREIYELVKSVQCKGQSVRLFKACKLIGMLLATLESEEK